MDLTEEKIFEAFGLEQTSANNPEAAEPDGQGDEPSDAAGATPPPPAGAPPLGRGGKENEEAADGDESDDPSGASRQLPLRRGAKENEEAEEGEEYESTRNAAQSAEERRRNAARRRERERQEAIEQAVTEALRQRDAEHEAATAEFFRQAGLANPYTKKPITSMEEFREWKKAQDEERVRQELASGKLTPETLRGMVNEAVRETAGTPSRVVNESDDPSGASGATPPPPAGAPPLGRGGKENEEAERQFERDVQEQLAEIQKSEPQVRELGDLMKQPWSAAFYEAVKRGNTFTDAYYLATREQQVQRAAEAARQAAEAARQQTLRSVQSKDHLRRTGVGGKPGADVSAEERKFYRLFNAGVTDDEIQAYANRQKS